MKCRKVFVKVLAEIDEQGSVRPKSVTWEDGREFLIDKVTKVQRACASKVGGTAIRYSIYIGGKQTYLYEDDGKWFVESRV
ncbi:MAG: hypothetical protein IJW86_01465 [Clostridia bacterium]|nr:hypothetical protein [Clostridia bacterium]